MEQGLTKENFWNDVEQKYPNSFRHFSQWIDEYKKEVDWDRLFANGQYFYEPDRSGGHRIDIKFHDLPFDMQRGILQRFIIENTLNGINPEWLKRDNEFFMWRLQQYFVLHNDNYTNAK